MAKAKPFIIVGNCGHYRQVRTFDLSHSSISNARGFMRQYERHLQGTWKIYRLQGTINTWYQFGDSMAQKLKEAEEKEEGFISIGEQILTEKMVKSFQ